MLQALLCQLYKIGCNRSSCHVNGFGNNYVVYYALNQKPRQNAFFWGYRIFYIYNTLPNTLLNNTLHTTLSCKIKTFLSPDRLAVSDAITLSYIMVASLFLFYQYVLKTRRAYLNLIEIVF